MNDNYFNTYNLCDYFDVWGNAKDGYEINNWAYPYGREYKLELSIDDDKSIVQELKRIGYLSKHCKVNMFEIVDECNGLIMIYRKKDYKPICCIEYRE